MVKKDIEYILDFLKNDCSCQSEIKDYCTQVLKHELFLKYEYIKNEVIK